MQAEPAGSQATRDSPEGPISALSLPSDREGALFLYLECGAAKASCSEEGTHLSLDLCLPTS